MALVVMTKRRQYAITAGILCGIFAVFAAATFALWAGDDIVAAFKSIPGIPGAMELFVVVAVLMIGSSVVAALLFFRVRVGLYVLISSVVISAGAVAWNVIAALFWLAPVPFVWLAYRARNDD